MAAGFAPYTTASPTASGTGLTKTTGSRWQPLPQPHPPSCFCRAAHRAPPRVVAVGCEAGFQHVPTGKCAACHMAWLLRDAKESGCSGESLPAAAGHGAQCTMPTTTTIPHSRTRQEQDTGKCQHCKQTTQSLSTQPAADLAPMPRPTHPKRELLPSCEGHSVLDPTLPFQVRWGWWGREGSQPALPLNPPSLFPC